ncbi:MAG: DnaB-like helicase C-terminal domain-containing protein [Dehalococcoidia bacterium]
MTASSDRILKQHLYWLLTHDVEFLNRYAKFVRADRIDAPEEKWLSQNAVEHWNKYRAPLSEDALTILLAEKVRLSSDKQFDPDIVESLFYADAPEDSVRLFISDYAHDYFRKEDSLYTVGEFADLVRAGKMDDAVEVLSAGVTQLTALVDVDDGVDVMDAKTVLADIKALFSDDGTAIPTAIDLLDSLMVGGLRPGELGVFLAPPGHGKSQWLVHVARAAWEIGINIVYFSFEMSAERVAARFYAGTVGIDSDQLAMNTKKALKTFNKLVAAGDYGSLRIKRYPDKGATCRDMTAYLEDRRAQGFPVDLVIVDYGDIVAPSTKHIDRREAQAEVYLEMRRMAEELGVPVWTASQANRAALRRNVVTIEHIADSFDKAKIADYIFAFSQTNEEKREKVGRVFVAKCRNNADGREVYVRYNFALSTFEEVPEEEVDQIVGTKQRTMVQEAA